LRVNFNQIVNLCRRVFFFSFPKVNDISKLAKIPGIGKKTAERLIMEMRDKLKELLPAELNSFAIPANSIQTVQDAISALVNLGYSSGVAQKAVKKSMQTLPIDADLAVVITHSLKEI
jgi:Holliday junction DNA helicase RuvA